MNSQLPSKPETTNRLQRGPAFEDSGASLSTRHSKPSSDWPTYRKDSVRSSATSSPVPSNLSLRWRTSFDGSITSPVVADGRLFVSQIDAQSVYAVDVPTGKRLWRFLCGGRVDGPPTIAQGRVVFGSADGWVYCLRAADGALVWRFRAAPLDRRIVAFDQVESRWPVHGSVLVQDDVVYASAGRSSYLDGGIHLYALNLDDGRMLHHTCVSTPEQQQDTTTTQTFNVAGALSDVLVGDEEFVFMRHVKFDRQLNQRSGLFPFAHPDKADSGAATGGETAQARGVRRRAMATAGFLDHSGYSRVYRACHDAWTGRYSARRTQQLAFDQTTVYGCRMYYDRGWKSPRFHSGEGALLFAQDHADTTPDKLPDIAQYSLHENIKWSFPIPRDTYRWSRRLPIWIQAMVLTPDKVVVAGRPDQIPADDPYGALDGRKGGTLFVVSTSNGEVLETRELPAPPTVDGVIVAGDIYVSTAQGHLQCWTGGALGANPN